MQMSLVQHEFRLNPEKASKVGGKGGNNGHKGVQMMMGSGMDLH